MCVEIDPVLRSMYAHIWVCWSVTPLGLVHSRLYSFGSIFELVELHEKWKQTIERKMQHTKTGCWIRLGKKKYFFFSPFFSDSGQVKKTKETLRGLEQLRAISLRLLPFLCFSFRAHEYLEGGEKKKKKYMRRERNISGTKRGRERARTHTRRVLLKMTLTARRDDTRNVRRGHQPSPPPPSFNYQQRQICFSFASICRLLMQGQVRSVCGVRSKRRNTFNISWDLFMPLWKVISIVRSNEFRSLFSLSLLWN